MISQASETIKFARVWRIFKRFLYSTMERIAKYEVNRSKMTRRLGIHMAKHKKNRVNYNDICFEKNIKIMLAVSS